MEQSTCYVGVYIHISGTASDVSGIFSVTMFRKTVSESRMVTPEKEELGVSMVWRAAPRGCGRRPG